MTRAERRPPQMRENQGRIRENQAWTCGSEEFQIGGVFYHFRGDFVILCPAVEHVCVSSSGRSTCPSGFSSRILFILGTMASVCQMTQSPVLSPCSLPIRIGIGLLLLVFSDLSVHLKIGVFSPFFSDFSLGIWICASR